jgi:hypothetical protein
MHPEQDDCPHARIPACRSAPKRHTCYHYAFQVLCFPQPRRCSGAAPLVSSVTASQIYRLAIVESFYRYILLLTKMECSPQGTVAPWGPANASMTGHCVGPFTEVCSWPRLHHLHCVYWRRFRCHGCASLKCDGDSHRPMCEGVSNTHNRVNGGSC